MEKENWKYVVEVDFLIGSMWPKGFCMYFRNLNQALQRVTEINLSDFNSKAEYDPFKGNQIIGLRIRDLETSSLVLELEKLTVTKLELNPDINRAPGIYFNFPQSIAEFVRLAEVDPKYFPAKESSLMIAHLEKENSKWIQPIIAFESLQRMFRSKNEERFTVDYEIQYFEKGGQGERQSVGMGKAEQYFVDNADEAIHKMLSTDFDKLDESVAWEKGLEFFYKSVTLSKQTTQIARLKSQRTGILQVGPYKPKEPGIFLKIDNKYREHLPSIPTGIYEADGIYRLGIYNEMRDSVIILDEVGTYRSQKNATGRLKSVKKTVQKNAPGKGSPTRIKRRKQ